MTSAIEKRLLFALNGRNGIIRGTCHLPPHGTAPPSADSSASQLGVVFLNSLSPTRAGKGDSSVFWAEAIAEHGYLTFRIDLPGFGDSSGDPPADLLDFINAGGYASPASEAVQQIAAKFRLSGIILFGLCAGAVSAIFTADITPQCCGLILLDPYFHLPLKPPPGVGRLTRLIPPGVTRRSLRYVKDRIVAAKARMVGRNLPANANLPLLSRCLRLVNSGTPILFLSAPAVRQKGNSFDYLSYILKQARSQSHVVHNSVQGADHTFSNLLGRRAVMQSIETWLTSCFSFALSEARCARVAEPDHKIIAKAPATI